MRRRCQKSTRKLSLHPADKHDHVYLQNKDGFPEDFMVPGEVDITHPNL